MNLSAEWSDELAHHGWTAVHWSTIGDPRAEDSVIMAWARANGHVVFTHDLDFGTMLALTRGRAVIQVRGQNVLPEHLGPLVIAALQQHDAALAAGALVVVEEKKCRVRVLPLQTPPNQTMKYRAAKTFSRGAKACQAARQLIFIVRPLIARHT
jgi:predicted nuclease of predicted toxin-antitoxin system